MFHRSGALAVALFITLTASAAFAQSAADVEKAQQHFARGAEKFAGGEYAKAVAEFMSGHALAPNAMFLYNVSLCYERLGNIEDAIAAGRRAQQFDGMPPEVAVRNEARIHAFTVALASAEVSTEMAAVVTNETNETTPDDPVVGQTITQSDGMTVIGWSGVALAAVGTGFILGGVVTNSAINSDIAQYEAAAAAGDAATYSELKADIDKKQGTGKLLYGVGFGAAGLGAALVIVDLLTGTEEVPIATVVPVRGGAVIGAMLRF